MSACQNENGTGASDVETRGSGGSMNWGPELLGAPSSGPQKNSKGRGGKGRREEGKG